jgi:hypothetical protein
MYALFIGLNYVLIPASCMQLRVAYFMYFYFILTFLTVALIILRLRVIS